MRNIVSPFAEDVGFSMKTYNDYAGLTLCPQEMELISPKAVQKRRIDFCLGRAAAQSALKKINICNFPVLKGIHNEPLWPIGVVGAISHCNGIALAAVASKEKTAGIGIDIEIITPKIFEDIAKEVCTKQEFAWVNNKADQKSKRTLMIFSAKESIFKAIFPITNVFLNFSDVELIWHEDKERFSGELQKTAGQDYKQGYIFEVGCQAIDHYIVTFIRLPVLKSDNV